MGYVGAGVSGSCRGGVGHLGTGVGGSCRDGMHHTRVEWAVKNFTEQFDLSQVRCSVFSSENCILDNVGEGMFVLVVALVESISVPLRTQATFLLLSAGTNIIIMPSRFLYKEHLAIIF